MHQILKMNKYIDILKQFRFLLGINEELEQVETFSELLSEMLACEAVLLDKDCITLVLEGKESDNPESVIKQLLVEHLIYSKEAVENPSIIDAIMQLV